MHTLKGAFPEVQVSGVPVPRVLFILPDLKLEFPPQAAERQIKCTWRGITESLLSPSSYTTKRKGGNLKRLKKNPSHETTITRQPKSEVVNLTTRQWQDYMEMKKHLKVVACGQNTMAQPSTVPCGHPTQQQGCSPRPPTQGLPLLGEGDNGICSISLGNNHS